MKLVWFRNDLRLADNPALRHACAEAGEVAALFVISPTQWQQHKMAPIRQQFLLAQVDELGRALAALGIPLHLLRVETFAEMPTALASLSRELGVSQLYANQAIEIDEQRRDLAVSAMLAEQEVSCHWFNGCCVLPPGRVLTGSGEMFKVFTPFSRAWLKALEEDGFVIHRAPAPRAEPLPWQPLAEREWSYGALGEVTPDPRWPVGEAEAQRRLHAFLEQAVLDYGETRDFPAQAGTSILSPYLAAGIISPRQCVGALQQRLGHRPQSKAEPGFVWLNELVWREFYRHLLVLVPTLSMNLPFKPETATLPWSWDPVAFATWCEGRTGYPIVDAAMRCLNATGWMHNRLRMIVASFLTKDLHIHWRLGEDYFMSQLIDGDLAANNGGWQWAAGTGADAAPYFRVFNPTTQGQRFDPQGDFIRTWVAELADIPTAYVHQPHDWLRLKGGRGYPAPMVDHALARVKAIEMFRNLEK
ncbi:deoxyribodipyrimidine photo-lyase [Aeromonas salmonicida]|uniref:deoxyribodipyrimidine photo-lyase n=1 Tax=Aeromonas salmonicida TaxID=645 RepID=UPI00073BD660|nr:deoxyribodipyrimidine photo-lyase [Aeromonas salmonicida]KTA80909.1 deoxyribodipyrimidine photolyase [Aeromonas salmonicida]MDE7528116.1 deoxyribodipyrimidine photo-lyase [Aeromonas salmonicida]MDE7532450.1 deoxyribodipyrimidine photo-lyase [Aeromonas salmonicida]